MYFFQNYDILLSVLKKHSLFGDIYCVCDDYSIPYIEVLFNTLLYNNLVFQGFQGFRGIVIENNYAAIDSMVWLILFAQAPSLLRL